MNVGVPKETVLYEKRVALVPDGVSRLVAAGLGVIVEAGAGSPSAVTDDAYREAGASIVDSPAEILGKTDVILKVQPPTAEEARAINEGSIVISFMQVVRNRDVIEILARRGATVLSMHRVPRITRAQSMDALSSQSNIAGYLYDTSTHQLTPLSGSPFGTGSGPQCIVEDPSNQFIYTANFNDSTVTGRTLDQNLGNLNSLSGKANQPYPLDGQPTWCLVSSRTS